MALLCLLLISPLPPPPSQTRTLDFEMLYGVKSSVSFSHVHWDYGHAYLTCTIWSGKETTPWTTTTAFPLDFFFIFWPLFVFFIRYCCSCYELRYFNKNRSDVKWLLFLIFSRILVQMDANKFSENSWNPGIFWPGQENTGNFETKNNLKGRDNNDRSRKPHEYVRRWQNEQQKYVPLF